MEPVTLTKRPFLTWEQLDWANKMGISAERAYWLASCPWDTKCGSKGREPSIHKQFKYETSFLHKPPNGAWYYFRMKRNNVSIKRKLSKDVNEARIMRDAIIAQMNLTLRK